MLLVMYPNTSMVTEKALSGELEDLPYVKSVTSMANTLPEGIPEEFLPYSLTSELHREIKAGCWCTSVQRQRAGKHFRIQGRLKKL